MKVIHENNKTSFVFTGHKGVGYYVNSSKFSITLTLSDFHPATYSDLLSLHNTTFDLTEPANGVFITERSTPDSVQILNGRFQFIRAQYLLVDQHPEEVILSGVFGFQALVNGGRLPFQMAGLMLGLVNIISSIIENGQPTFFIIAIFL